MKLKEIGTMTVVHCDTAKKVVELLDALREKDYTPEIWNRHKENTCVRTNSEKVCGFDCTDYYIANGYKITEFSDLIIPELSAKEVLETMADICKEYTLNSCGIECPLMNNCLFEEIAEDIDKTIDICTKWREKHPKEEKKELETEWVYVVRIIKVENNGFKKCVYEEDFPSLIEKPTVEDVLKHYCSEHNGNFFATLEHICRIKE